MISEERLAEIRERCEKATPGPWEWDERGWTIEGSGKSIVETDCRCYPPEDDDASFIIHARTDLPDLLAAYEALKAENAALLKANTPLRWSKERPTVGGLYHAKISEHLASFVIVYALHNKIRCADIATDDDWAIDDKDLPFTHFAGPLPESEGE